MSSALLQIETEIKERLESIPFFADFAARDAILVEPRKNILAEINRKLGQLSTVIVPKIVGADDNHPNVNGVYFDSIRISVGVFQRDLLKGSDAGYVEIAEEIHKALKWWTPDSLVNALNPAKPGIEFINDPKLNSAACNFETKGGFIGELPRVATPTGSDASGATVTLSCATPGAAIFYTTDGSNPIPRTATLYTAPFLITNARVKARAYLAGYLRSELLSEIYQQS